MIQEKPLVSVIIPVFNVLPYLRTSLDSILNQTYENLEIIIIDDGSTDGSAAVCDEYLKDSRVRVIHQENRGLSGARNTGLDVMTGEFVSFFDPDDIFLPGMIQVMTESIVRTNADIAICNFDSFQDDSSVNLPEAVPVSEERVLTSSEALNALITGQICFAVWNKIYHKRLLETFRFSEGHVHEDVEASYRLLEKCRRILIVPQTLVLYRLRKDSISRTISLANTLDYLQAWRGLEEYVRSHTPEVFEEKNVRTFCDNDAHGLCWRYIESRHLPELSEVSKTLRSDALRLWRGMDRLPAKTFMLFTLLKYAPGLILPVSECFRFVKSLWGKGCETNG